jgi:hypothetical protein
MPLGLQEKAVGAGSVTVRDSVPELPNINPNGIDPLLLEIVSDDPWTPKGRKN